MSVVLIFIHVVACICLVCVILMQSGRGGGLTEGFAPAESLFGTRTSQFMVRATVVLATVFLTTSLSLAYLSAKRRSSLVPDVPQDVAEKTVETPSADSLQAPAAGEQTAAQPEGQAPDMPVSSEAVPAAQEPATAPAGGQ